MQWSFASHLTQVLCDVGSLATSLSFFLWLPWHHFFSIVSFLSGCSFWVAFSGTSSPAHGVFQFSSRCCSCPLHFSLCMLPGCLTNGTALTGMPVTLRSTSLPQGSLLALHLHIQTHKVRHVPRWAYYICPQMAHLFDLSSGWATILLRPRNLCVILTFFSLTFIPDIQFIIKISLILPSFHFSLLMLQFPTVCWYSWDNLPTLNSAGWDRMG